MMRERAFLCLFVLGACAGEGSQSEAARAPVESGHLTQGTKLQGTKLQGTKLQGTKLQGTKLQGTKLQGTKLQGTVLSGFALVPPDGDDPALGGGWEFHGIGTCAAGASVAMSGGGGANVRVCEGRFMCAVGAPAEMTAGVGSAAFVCPTGGAYTVLADADAALTASVGTFPLTYPVAGMDLVGATLVGLDDTGGEIELRVDAVDVDPEVAAGDVLLYTILYRNSVTGAWESICDADADGVRKSIPIAGTWDDSGAHAASTTLITFGCTVGVLAKCTRWGYRPWVYPEHHQACTRMARADYCGDGVSHTYDGTAIDVWDSIPIQSRTPGGGMLYEASWTTSGAYCVSKWRWDLDGVALLLECPWKIALPTLQDLLAGCLVKLTWASQPSIRTNNDSYIGLSPLP